ncbi:MAG: N-6 DNA methylase [Leptospiraceae bacterium]|nr:N-6 DNA methylase [Leptospiraceae bacterium]MCP5494779.1 N-6 DNA methylase [Leptospiraceae bacterium]
MKTVKNSNSKVLEQVYTQLDYTSGTLVDIHSETKNWLEVGDWIETAKNIHGISRIFFIKNSPFILFASTEKPEEIINIFNNSWCMMRPKLLYVASSGEITLYDLSKEPVKTFEELNERVLREIKSIVEILEKLKSYSREKIESYDLEINKFSGGAEYRFTQDLNFIRNRLIQKGLKDEKLKYAHALIGRSIFIKYLEDREILTKDYFLKVAGKKEEWRSLLSTSLEKSDVSGNTNFYYAKVLRNKEYTYSLFNQLKEDFNGDMFSSDELEKEYIKQEHLNLLSGFLLGDSKEENLFFWAYNFKFIPIEIISSIYEEFYHKINSEKTSHGKKNSLDTKGTNYTPTTLVEFLVSDTLTEDILRKNPKILDPACGSGIFLVESYKRIIRFQRLTKKRRLSYKELISILKNQIFGIEINEAALRITSFSLYLALLNHLEPKDILENISQNRKLPRLLFSEKERGDDSYNILVHCNTFKINDLYTFQEIKSNFSQGNIDVVIGNPPWGSKLDTNSKSIMQKWCDDHNFPIGDKEPSQAFIGVSISFLKENGIAGFLVSSGVFFKHGISKQFRDNWLSQTQLKKVVNFDHVRDVFFSGGRKKDSISPFASVIFVKSKLDNTHVFEYWTAKKVSSLNSTKIIILHKTDLKLVKQDDFIRNHKLWKIYWWGGHRDRDLIEYLDSFEKLESYIDDIGQGLKENDKQLGHKNFELGLKILESKNFTRYGKLIQKRDLVDPPALVCQLGMVEMYYGERILLSRGIKQQRANKGIITARYEDFSFCFRHSINSLKLVNPSESNYKVLLGIIWSSLAMYYWFQIASQWGQWHHALHIEEIIDLPIQFPEDKKLKQRIIQIVDQLRNIEEDSFFNESSNSNTITKLEAELDEAVFELYNLNQNEIDLIKETCDIKLDLLYNNLKSKAIKKLKWDCDTVYGLQKDLEFIKEKSEIKDYLLNFLGVWNQKLSTKGEIMWQILFPENSPLIGFLFYPHEKNKPILKLDTSQKEWKQILQELSEKFLIQNTAHIYTDGSLRIISDQYILILKRNERRLWTKNTALEDAEAILVQAIHKQKEIKR